MFVRILVVLLVACSSSPPRDQVTDAQRQQIRTSVPRLRPGMARPDVLRTIGVPLDKLPQIATGPTTEVTTIYVLGGVDDLYLTWDASQPGEPILLRAQLVLRGLPPGPGSG